MTVTPSPDVAAALRESRPAVILVVGDVVDDIDVRPLEAVNPRIETRSEIRMTPGGSAANTAAWLGLLGTEVRFFGKAGADGVARHEAALRDAGVDPVIVADPDLPTAAIVLTEGGDADRTTYIDRGASGTLTVEDVPADLFDDVTWVHFSGYTLFDPATRPVALHLMKEARERDMGVSVDPASAGFLRQASADEFRAWTAGVDMVFPNLDEVRVLVGATGPYVDFESLTETYPHVVVKLGSMGAAYIGRDGREQAAAARVEVVDTTGAGDAFAAGFLTSWLEHGDPSKGLAAGTGAAQRCIQQSGARPE